MNVNAVTVVHYLLEQRRRAGYYMFTQLSKKGGFFFRNPQTVAKILADRIHQSLDEYSVEEIFDLFIKQGATLFIVDGSNTIYYRGYIPVWPTKEAELEFKRTFNLTGFEKVVPFDNPTLPATHSITYALNGHETRNTLRYFSKQGEYLGRPEDEVEYYHELGLDFPKHAVGSSGDIQAAPAKYFGIYYDRTAKDGVTVLRVEPNSPAEQAGIKPNDIIVQVGKYVQDDDSEQGPFWIKTGNQLEFVIYSAKTGKELPLRIVRGDADLWVKVKPMAENERWASDEGSKTYKQDPQTRLTAKKIFKSRPKGNLSKPIQRALSSEPKGEGPSRYLKGHE